MAHGSPLDSPFVLEAHLYTCDRTISQTMQLGAVSDLQLSYEQPADVAVPLRMDDRVRVAAAFVDPSAPPQNLSAQVDVTTADGYAPDIASTITSCSSRRSRIFWALYSARSDLVIATIIGTPAALV